MIVLGPKLSYIDLCASFFHKSKKIGMAKKLLILGKIIVFFNYESFSLFQKQNYRTINYRFIMRLVTLIAPLVYSLLPYVCVCVLFLLRR